MILWLVVLAFSPGIFWLWYVYQKDRWEPEPRALVVRMFLLGMACALLAALAEAPFFWSGFFLIVVAAPVIEEYAKYFVVSRTVYKNIEFSEPMDGIVYSAAAALGFASVENFLYLLAAQHQDVLAPVFIGRALFSVPGMCSSRRSGVQHWGGPSLSLILDARRCSSEAGCSRRWPRTGSLIS